MKAAPISGDMLVKLALGAAALGALYFAWSKVSDVAGDAIDGIGEAASAAGGAILTGINPGNSDNLVNKAASAIGGSVITDPAGPGKNADGSWTVGGWLYDVTHPGWQTEINAPVPPKTTPKPAGLFNYLTNW